MNGLYVDVGHHLFGGDGGFVAPDDPLVDVRVESGQLEPPQQEHNRNGQDGNGGQQSANNQYPLRVLCQHALALYFIRISISPISKLFIDSHSC